MSSLTTHPDVQPGSRLWSRLAIFAGDIKFSHTIFALPWALLATFLAAGGLPHASQVLLILVCMITARTVAMASNRLLDASLDALNPRTVGRAIPSGKLARGFYVAATAIGSSAFIAAASMFWFWHGNRWPALLCVPVLAFISAYPLLKRFTKLCHYYLGAALALAPLCAWIAITPAISAEPFLMACAVLLWTAGFDIIYACQDYQSDIATGVVSIPARLGIAKALWLARLTHVLSFTAMVVVGLTSPALGTLYFAGVACAGMLLVIEHSLVSPADLSKVGLAFFTINGLISLLVGTLGIADVFV